MRWFAMLLAYASCSACAAEPDCGGSFRIEPGAPAEVTRAAERAGERWNRWLGESAAVRIAPDGRCPIVAGPIEDSANTAEYNWTTGEIRVDFSKRHCGSAACLEHLLAHELGHSLGLEDIAGRGMMAGHSERATEGFTDADLIECRRVGRCQ
jgi:hypothetical protein